jgi:hypothetical protein
VGTPDDGGRLPPRDLTGEQIFTERDFRDREGSAGRRATDDGEGRRTTEAPDDGSAGRWTTEPATSLTGGKFQNSEDWAALESPDDGRRTTGAPDDGQRTTGSPDLYGERFQREREVFVRNEKFEIPTFFGLRFSSSMTKREKKNSILLLPRWRVVEKL